MGFYIFTLGLIIAIIGAAKPAASIGAWPDTTFIFVIGALVATVGLVMWRKSVTAALASSSESDGTPGATTDSAMGLLKAFSQKLDSFGAQLMGWDAPRLQEEAETFFDGVITPIVEKRYELIHQLGMAKGAEIVLEFSRGERFFNRMHTAALDGHLDEAHSAWPSAKEAFEAAIKKL